MTLRGEHFLIDDFENGPGPALEEKPAPVNPFDFIGDVKERATSIPTPPQPPSLRNAGGFPAHRKRNFQSRFKKSRQAETQGVDRPDDDEEVAQQNLRPQNEASLPANSGDDGFMSSERQRIDEENRNRLAEMSPEEIEEERAELFKALDPSLIQRLLGRTILQDAGRAVIEEGGSNEDFPGLEKEKDKAEAKIPKPRKSVKFAETAEETDSTLGNDTKGSNSVGDEAPSQAPAVSENEIAGNVAAAEESLPFDSSIHFPHAPQPPSLDPSSDTFLADLHEKYFPSLPEDPEKLEWMRSTPSDSAAYSTSQSSLGPKDIRFSFSGALIPPSLAAQIPVTEGLHHHGEAPDAAGYTIPELGLLARSSVPAQRCMAFQTLGRIFYRLGKGEFGNAGDGGAGTVGAEDTLGELARGLWGEVEREKVIETCVAESEGKVAGGRHVSAKAYATEAVWLWQKGGGRRWKAT